MNLRTLPLVASLLALLSLFSARALTVIVDFNDPGQGTTSTYFSGGGDPPAKLMTWYITRWR